MIYLKHCTMKIVPFIRRIIHQCTSKTFGEASPLKHPMFSSTSIMWKLSARGMVQYPLANVQDLYVSFLRLYWLQKETLHHNNELLWTKTKCFSFIVQLRYMSLLCTLSLVLLSCPCPGGCSCCEIKFSFKE